MIRAAFAVRRAWWRLSYRVGAWRYRRRMHRHERDRLARTWREEYR